MPGAQWSVTAAPAMVSCWRHTALDGCSALCACDAAAAMAIDTAFAEAAPAAWAGTPWHERARPESALSLLGQKYRKAGDED